MTHITRPVISKGLWRDFRVCHELDRLLGQEHRQGVLYILTSGGGVRRPQDVLSMEEHYGWPRNHREGYPDLVGPEVGLGRDADEFNARHSNIQVVLVNQFGWSQSRIGKRLPAKMDISDLRRATDVEFGMATYEPSASARSNLFPVGRSVWYPVFVDARALSITSPATRAPPTWSSPISPGWTTKARWKRSRP